MDVSIISSMFEGLPRQGPGLDEATAFAAAFIPPGDRRGRILDIGCGSGMQTLTLARICPDCRITASDLHQPFLDDLTRRAAAAAGLSGRIETRRVSMDDLPFRDGEFDIIWAEGSAFIIGVRQALQYWKKFIRPSGYLVLSDMFWFTRSPSVMSTTFVSEAAPDTLMEDDAEEMIAAEGYTVMGSFRLPESGWWTHYYLPLEDRLGGLSQRYAGNPDALVIIDGLKREIETFRHCSQEYGYRYFILRGPGADTREEDQR